MRYFLDPFLFGYNKMRMNDSLLQIFLKKIALDLSLVLASYLYHF
jgi:hypothetical protein